MIPLNHIPPFVRQIFHSMPGVWKSKHELFLCWLILMHSVASGKKNLKELSRSTPEHITEWRFRRLLKSLYWSIHLLVHWFAMEAINRCPPPEDGTIYLLGDSSHKAKTGKKNPVVQKGKNNSNNPWFFGIRFCLLVACWDVYRIPIGFRIILPKIHPEYAKENELFREMISSFEPPLWAKTVIVLGDAAYASKENIIAVQNKNKADRLRSWYFLFSIARTWKTTENKSIKNLVTHIPRGYFKRTWTPSLTEGGKRKVFFTYMKKVNLRHIGDVTLVLSKKRHNIGPAKTKILVTNLPNVNARETISIYLRRWSIEIIFKELKSAIGLGESQITKDKERVEKSFGIAIISYLFLLIACNKSIKSGHSWSLFKLQNEFRIRVISHQIKHSVTLSMKKQQ
jgi:hypothetical protein